MVRTKIVATIGPASRSPETLRKIIDQGLDVARLNMSHGALPDQQQSLENVRRVATECGAHVAVMADLAGPKVRTCTMDPDPDILETGQTCEIVRNLDVGTARRFATNYERLVDELEPGHRVLIDDGLVRLRVQKKTADSVVCTCETGGPIGTRKGVNVPDTTLTIDSLTEKDIRDLTWAAEQKVDYIALSFVRRPQDVTGLRARLEGFGADIPIISKIETPQAIDAIDDIIAVSDAILVARGDLGVEMDVTLVPLLQKDIVQRCRPAGTPVIIATQMLHSMIRQSSPTRAEVSDVANAAIEGADAVMLSGETATGEHPVEAVSIMNRICAQANHFADRSGNRLADFLPNRLRVGHDIDPTTSAVARSAVMVAHDLDAKLIAAWCTTGRTARWLSKYQVPQPLVALSRDSSVCRQLALSYGVEPMLVRDDQVDNNTLRAEIQQRLGHDYELKPDDFFVMVGDPEGGDRRNSISILSLRQIAQQRD